MAFRYVIPVFLSLVLGASAARIKTVGDAPCDLTKANFDKYEKRFKKACPASGCKFWDTCPKEGKTCQSGCEPYSAALGLTMTQRATKSVGHTFSRSCEKECRYKDETMLQTAEDGGNFAVTSAAILEDKLALMEDKCGSIFSSMSPSCAVRQRKIAAMFGFLNLDIVKAANYARAGEVSKCNAVLPPEIRMQVSTGLLKVIEMVISAGQLSKQETALFRAFARSPILPDLCNKLHELQQPNANATTIANLKKALQQEAGGKLSADKLSLLDKAIATMESQGAENFLDQALKEDEHKVQDELAKSAVLAEMSGKNNSSSLVQLDHEGFFTGLFMGFWSLIFHATLGTVYGALTSALCLASGGLLTDALWISYNEFSGYKRSTWLVKCPLVMFGNGWGFRGSSRDPISAFSLSWKDVDNAFMGY